MSPSPNRHDIRAIEVEASAWIAQLNSDEFSEADLAALREWSARSLAHHAALKRLASIWSELDILATLPGEPLSAQTSSAQPKLRWTPFWVAHASIVFLAFIGAALWMGFIPGRDAQAPVSFHATNVGEQRTVTLADHSTIRLNTNTFLEVDYGSHERRVRLVKGEALFTVAKDATRPFVVHAAANTVRAIGTQFSVRLLQDDVEVLVTEGKVTLTRSLVDGARSDNLGRRDAVLSAAETAWIDDRPAVSMAISQIPPAELQRRLSWTTGILEFNGEPLERVVAEVGRYTSLHIRIAQPALRQLPVGGRFRVGETQALFDVIEAGFGAKVIHDADGVLITMEPPVSRSPPKDSLEQQHPH